MSDPDAHSSDSRALTPRKRVVARELTEVEAANRHAAELARADVIIPRAPDSPGPAEPVVVVDPTTLGRRHRRSSHQRIYRWTQSCSILAFLAGGVGIVCLLGEDITVARAVAGPGVALGIIATILAGRTSLSERWRGWAIAAAVFAAAVLLLTWIQPAIMSEEHGDARPRTPAKSGPAAPDTRQP
jgi:hypothetical protein